ncbi:hypothetical protein B0I35DRAFT_137241 [Stachybotrys elegans]|uniref:Uncharacterized protein n=1 Tax=Stachybotrys elegans TaxID=80388 RepID=A0A8K0T122_9HYPO|nr:hypothetical protein B0I35DRAFT_137241 [Stachybotrys elegans]
MSIDSRYSGLQGHVGITTRSSHRKRSRPSAVSLWSRPMIPTRAMHSCVYSSDHRHRQQQSWIEEGKASRAKTMGCACSTWQQQSTCTTTDGKASADAESDGAAHVDGPSWQALWPPLETGGLHRTVGDGRLRHEMVRRRLRHAHRWRASRAPCSSSTTPLWSARSLLGPSIALGPLWASLCVCGISATLCAVLYGTWCCNPQRASADSR